MPIIKTTGPGGSTTYSDRETGSAGGVVVANLARLIPPAPADNRLAPAVAPKAIRDQTGLSARQATRVRGSEVTVQSTDGLFTFVVTVVAR